MVTGYPRPPGGSVTSGDVGGSRDLGSSHPSEVNVAAGGVTWPWPMTMQGALFQGKTRSGKSSDIKSVKTDEQSSIYPA